MTEAELAESIAVELVAAKLIRASNQAELSTELAKGEVDASEWARLLMAEVAAEPVSEEEGGVE